MVRPKSTIDRKQFGARVNPEVIKKLKHLAVDKGVSFNILIEEALEDLLKKNKQK
jgi:predicted HicB family RNase H-like nuclease